MVIIHEIGHVIAIYLIGGRVEKFEFSWSLIKGIFKYPKNLTLKKYIFFTANGIIMQLLMTVTVIFFVKDPIWLSFGFFYLCIIAINLVPLSITDGAFIFKSYPSSKIKGLLWLSVGFLFTLSILGLFFLWKQLYTELHIKMVLTFFYVLMLIMSIRKISYLYLEGNYDG